MLFTSKVSDNLRLDLVFGGSEVTQPYFY